jgi:type IV secretion system protein VirD4
MSLSVPQEGNGLPVLGSTALDAVTIGRKVEKPYGITNRIRYGGDKHLLVFGPNGKGKGTRILMPNLLQMAGNKSVVVVDPKGELAAVTAPHRRTLGRVVIINPFGVLTDFDGYEDLTSCGFNPLATLDPAAPDFNTRAAMLADALVTVEGKDPHWSNSARALIAALLMYVTIEARERGTVPQIARFRELLCEASDSAHAGNNFEGVGLPKRAAEMMRSSIAGLRNKAAQFTDWNREIQSIASTARIQTEPFDDAEIAGDLAKDGFDFRELKREPVTVYLILPPEAMGRHSKWLRLVLTAAIQGVLRARRPGEPRTLFMLDEFFALGHLEIISTVWALVRGYGIQIMPVLQDLGQLKKLYPDMWETFIGMAGVVMYFAPNDVTTAEYLSRRAGDTTRKATSTSTSHSTSTGDSGGQSPGGINSGWNKGTSYSSNTNTSPVKVPLIAHHNLFGLKPGFCLMTADGVSNITGVYAPAYYQIKQCVGRSRANPYYLGED